MTLDSIHMLLHIKWCMMSRIVHMEIQSTENISECKVTSIRCIKDTFARARTRPWPKGSH